MKEIIESLRKAGKSYKEISEETGLCKSTISYYIGDKKGRIAKKKCKGCEELIISSKTYCSKDCWLKDVSKTRLKNLDEGKLATNNTIRRALAQRDGDKCSKCGTLPIWNNEKLTLHVDHIDGNSDDNSSENLRLLCPNCHSQLETSKDKKHKKDTKRNKYLRKYKGYEDASLV